MTVKANTPNEYRPGTEQEPRRWMWGRPHVLRDVGEGATFYLGNRKGAPYIGFNPIGFNGWSSSRWMPGGWEFFTPHIHTGRLYSDERGHWWEMRVLIPARLWDFYYWRVKPSGRRYMREHRHDAPLSKESEKG